MTSLRRFRIGAIQSDASFEVLEASVGRISAGLTHLAVYSTACYDDGNDCIWNPLAMANLEVICSTHNILMRIQDVSC